MRIQHKRTECPCQYCGKKHSDVRIVKETGNETYVYTAVDYICSDCAEKIRQGLYTGPQRDWAYIANDLREWHKAIESAPELVILSTLLETAAKAILELSGAKELKVKSSEMKVIPMKGSNG